MISGFGRETFVFVVFVIYASAARKPAVARRGGGGGGAPDLRRRVGHRSRYRYRRKRAAAVRETTTGSSGYRWLIAREIEWDGNRSSAAVRYTPQQTPCEFDYRSDGRTDRPACAGNGRKRRRARTKRIPSVIIIIVIILTPKLSSVAVYCYYVIRCGRRRW